MYCNHCGHQQKDNAKFCHNCGTNLSDNSVTATTLPTPSSNTGGDTKILEFYVVPTSKFLLLSLLSFGLYPIFWFAKNWALVKQQEKSSIYPIARAIFGVFYFSSLAERVLKSAKARGYDRNYYSALLAIGYFFLSFLYRLEDPNYAWLLGFTSVLTFIPVLEAIKYNNDKSSFRNNDFAKYGTGEIIAMVIGGILWILVLIGMFS